MQATAFLMKKDKTLHDDGLSARHRLSSMYDEAHYQSLIPRHSLLWLGSFCWAPLYSQRQEPTAAIEYKEKQPTRPAKPRPAAECSRLSLSLLLERSNELPFVFRYYHID